MKSQYNEPADLKVFVKGKGVVVNIKALIAMDTETNKVMAIGSEAYEAEKTGKFHMISPFHQGKIADYQGALVLFRYCLGKAGMKLISLRKPDIAICIPDTVNMVEKRAYEEAVHQCGSNSVYIIYEPFDFVIQNLENAPIKELRNIKYIIGITKDEPVAYLKEALTEVFELAKTQGFDKDWIKEYLEQYDAQ